MADQSRSENHRAFAFQDETEHLKRHGASEVVMGEHEIAKAMIAAIPPSG